MSRRIIIMGVPRSGKSTLAARLGGALGVVLRSTDDLIGAGLDWSAVSEVVAEEWFRKPGPWVCEGVRAVHAARKWCLSNAEGLPADMFVWCDVPRFALTPKQASFAKGLRGIWTRDVLPELQRRGAMIANDTEGWMAA